MGKRASDRRPPHHNSNIESLRPHSVLVDKNTERPGRTCESPKKHLERDYAQKEIPTKLHTYMRIPFPAPHRPKIIGIEHRWNNPLPLRPYARCNPCRTTSQPAACLDPPPSPRPPAHTPGTPPPSAPPCARAPCASFFTRELVSLGRVSERGDSEGQERLEPAFRR